MTNIKLTNKRNKYKIEPILLLTAVTILTLVMLVVAAQPENQSSKVINNNITIKQPQKQTIQEEVVTKEEIPIYKVPLSEELQRYTYELCDQYNVSYELVLAIMYQESRMNPAATYTNTNGTQDKGLMQINSRYLKSWVESYKLKDFNVYDPKDNIKLGILILSDRIAYWDNRNYADELLFHASLSSYNRGISGYNSYKKKYGYETTYSNQVLNYKEELETISTFSNFSIDK